MLHAVASFSDLVVRQVQILNISVQALQDFKTSALSQTILREVYSACLTVLEALAKCLSIFLANFECMNVESGIIAPLGNHTHGSGEEVKFLNFLKVSNWSLPLILLLLDISPHIFVLAIEIVDCINPDTVFIGLLIARIARLLLLFYGLANALPSLLY